MAPARTLLFALLAAAFVPRAEAIVLYKSVGPNGVIEFSDMPPAGNAKILEERDLGARPSTATANGLPITSGSTTPMMDAVLNDDAVARAMSQVDLAEHALALARRGVWAANEGVHLRSPARTAADEQRIDYYKRGVMAARQTLLEVIKQRLAASTTSATTVASR